MTTQTQLLLGAEPETGMATTLRAAIEKHQADVATVNSTIATLQNAIAEQQQKLEGQEDHAPRIAELERERQDISAQLALGNGDAAQLDQVKKELSDLEKKRSKAGDSAADIRATIEGLQRQLAEAEAELSVIRDQDKNIALEVLRAEIEEVGAEYAKSAEVVAIGYNRLIGLGLAIDQIKGDRFGSYGDTLNQELSTCLTSSIVNCSI